MDWEISLPTVTGSNIIGVIAKVLFGVALGSTVVYVQDGMTSAESGSDIV